MTPGLAALLDAIPVGILLADGSGRIRAANRAAAERLGRSAGELAGLPLEEALAGRADAPPVPARLCPYEDDAGAAVAAVLEPADLSRAAEIASGVKHDVNNLLMGLLGQAALLAVRPELTDMSRQKVELIEKQGIRIRDCVAGLDAIRRIWGGDDGHQG